MRALELHKDRVRPTRIYVACEKAARYRPVKFQMLHRVYKDVDFLVVREICRNIADAGFENFWVEDAHGGRPGRSAGQPNASRSVSHGGRPHRRLDIIEAQLYLERGETGRSETRDIEN